VYLQRIENPSHFLCFCCQGFLQRTDCARAVTCYSSSAIPVHCMICNRCGKRFASQASVQKHQNQLSSNCWKTYSLLLDLQQQPQAHAETSQPSPSLPPSPSESTSPPLEVDMDSPPPTPSSLPEVDMEVVNDINELPQPEQEAALPPFHTEFFLGSSKVFGNGDTYLDLFNEDEYADARKTNLYYPFASQPEWEVASFLLKSDLSREAIDRFLKLQLVSKMKSIELSDRFTCSSDSRHRSIFQNCQRPWQSC
jgi:hypothetical protein